ncbi:MAG: radical SAM protein [Desulfobacteraceae bacterium]|jgi:radical SAM family uncharacterized protein
MTKPKYQKILKNSVAEYGAIKKNWHSRKTIALVYPNTYYTGMSNLGFQTVYNLFNGFENVVCERVFLPAVATKDTRQFCSVESARRLAEFDLIAFSISFENDYINILEIINKSQLPLTASERDDTCPIIIAGGVTCFINPEPIALFFDAFLIGEAEEMIPSLMEIIDDLTDATIGRKKRLLQLAQKVPGAYVPAFYEPHYCENGILSDFEPIEDVPTKIKALHTADLSLYSSCSTILTADTTFDNTFLIEVSRGCPHGCRFCSAGYIYRPPRFRSFSQLERDIRMGKQQTNRIGLVGAAVSDLPNIEKLCTGEVAQGLQVGFSSLRADALSDELINALKNSDIKTATIAPDAGSERLRAVINKGLDENEILSATTALVQNNIPNLKLYFMIGLPTETAEDVDAIISLCKKIKDAFLYASRPKGRMGEITVSINCFVPKPFTPFQWATMDNTKHLKQKIKRIKQALGKVANIRVHADAPRWGFIQAILSRGDRRVSQLLMTADKNSGNWSQTLKNTSIDPLLYIQRRRLETELFPWDFIDHGINKTFLWKEYQRALIAQKSPPCPIDRKKCRRCGVCG